MKTVKLKLRIALLLLYFARGIYSVVHGTKSTEYMQVMANIEAAKYLLKKCV